MTFANIQTKNRPAKLSQRESWAAIIAEMWLVQLQHEEIRAGKGTQEKGKCKCIIVTSATIQLEIRNGFMNTRRVTVSNQCWSLTCALIP